MPTKSLPNNPSLVHLKRQARDLQQEIRRKSAQAAQRVREFHPRYRELSDPEIFERNFARADAQLVIAREYRFPSWTRLKDALSTDRPDEKLPHHERILDPVFRQAVDLLDAGDEAGLKALLVQHPELAHQKTYFDSGAYFGSPTLLEFVAENPIRRGQLPKNILGIARTILDAGASRDQRSLDQTLELVSSGMVALKERVQIPLIELLIRYGARPNYALDAAATHGEFEAVKALIGAGATLDIATAAATNRFEEVRRLLPTATEAAKYKALAYAAQFGRTPILDLLLDAGVDPRRYNPIGLHSHSTPLHQAALGGHFEAVRSLVKAGADLNARDTIYQGTPRDWALHAGKVEIASYLKDLEGS